MKKTRKTFKIAMFISLICLTCTAFAADATIYPGSIFWAIAGQESEDVYYSNMGYVYWYGTSEPGYFIARIGRETVTINNDITAIITVYDGNSSENITCTLYSVNLYHNDYEMAQDTSSGTGTQDLEMELTSFFNGTELSLDCCLPEYDGGVSYIKTVKIVED